MIPAATMMAGGHLDSLYQADVRGGGMALERSAASDEVARAWSERMMERERELVVASFAKEFDIPVSLAGTIHKAALEAKIPPKMAFGLVQAESSFRTRAVSPVGAVGLTQVMPATARWLVPGTTRADLMNTETNLRIGFSYLRQLIDQYDGDEKLALTAYNRGPGTVSRVMRQGRDPDNGYADKVLTGRSDMHVRLMNARFGRSRG
ncbi:MAG TPA: lytic transglycosylase domain-containing protein [Longimicrobiales bacterium]|nr:lytic transglycosylase domain-containing protein [Longimicrobiales bacterium]